MKTECTLIRDILPVYVKGETSEESNAIIGEHLSECEDCRALHELLLADDNKTEKNENFSRSMKKVKRRVHLKAVTAALIAAVIVSGVFLFTFWGMIPVKSSSVEIVPEAFVTKEDGVDFYHVEFHLALLEPGRCIDLRHGLFNISSGADDNYKATVYSQVKLPFDDRGKNPECFDAGAAYSELTGEETMAFHFRDKDVEYNIKDIIEEAGLIK